MQLPLPNQNTRLYTVCHDASIPLGIVVQDWPQDFPNIRCCQLWHNQLHSVQTAGCIHLPGKGGVERSGLQGGNQSGRQDVHGGQLRVGQKSCAIVENGAVVKFPILLYDSDIVQMAVIIAEQGIYLKKQSQVLGEQL